MTESEFNDRVDATLEQIEEILDDAETDLDYQSGGGILTVVCENGSQVIFTRQTPVKQLWVATRGGGFHFEFDTASDNWLRDSDQQPLNEFLQAVFQEQAGESFRF